MKENKIELTKEQKNCVEYDLEKKLLVIEANPGTGKTEVLKNRVFYIHQQNKQQRKLILVLSYNRNIVGEIGTKLKAEKLKTYRRFKDFVANINHRHTCSLNECPTYLENTKPLILVCTIHSLANGINSLVLAKQFSEKRKIKVLTTTQRVENKHGFVTGKENKHKFTWQSKGPMTSRKKGLFKYLSKQGIENYLDKDKYKKLWDIFKQNVELIKVDNPFYYYDVNYSHFLTRVPILLPEEEKLLAMIEKICQSDREENVWMDFDDMITNANLLTKSPDQKLWANFDYILVDECQDLKEETLNLITEIFGNDQTKFTFVGDPKQNIMGFAGARADIFQLLKEKFSPEVFNKSVITLSFRFSTEVADFANHFVSAFTTHEPSNRAKKSHIGFKPHIIIVGQEADYWLSPEEKQEIAEVIAENPELKKSNLIQEKIRNKKLHKHLEVIWPIIDKLDTSASKAILYRQNWIGSLLQKWLDQKATTTNISEKIIKDMVRKVSRRMKENNSLTEFSSLKSFLTSLKIPEDSVFQLPEIIKKIDEKEGNNSSLTVNQVNDFINQLTAIKNDLGIKLSTIHGMKGLEADYIFLIFCDQKILPKKEKFNNDWEEKEEKNLFFTAITRPKMGIYITTSSQQECSNFINPSNLNHDLVELIDKNDNN